MTVIDEVIELNTLSENSVSAARALIGELKAVIIKVNKKTQLNIYFKDMPNVKILSMRELEGGDHYLPLKIESRAVDGSLLREDNSKWCFNADDIVFKMEGGNDTTAQIKMRLEVEE